VVNSNGWYVARLAVARRIQNALPSWKELCWGNSGHRADEVSVFDLVGTEYPAVEKEHEFCLGLQKIVNQHLSVVEKEFHVPAGCFTMM
jgi:hypothetical protein